jgi:hypothetical protein
MVEYNRHPLIGPWWRAPLVLIEGNTLKNSSCSEAINALADWIARAYKGQAVRLAKMIATWEARDKAAHDIIGMYYPAMPVFKELCDAVADCPETRRSLVREALRCLNDRKEQSKDRALTTRLSESSMHNLARSAVS